MKNIVLFLFCGLLAQRSFSQTADQSADTTKKVYLFAEAMPEYSGGKELLIQYIRQHIQYVPDSSNAMLDQKIYVQFIVHADSTVDQVTLLRGNNPALFEAVKQVITGMPGWIPGIQSGKPVDVYWKMPVQVEL